MGSEESETFNRLSLGATLRKTYELYSRGFKLLISLSALTMILMWGAWSILLLTLISAVFDIEADKLSDPSYLLAHIGEYYAALGIYMMVCIVIGSLMSGPMVRAIVDLYMGKQPNLKQCLKLGIKRAPTIFCASVVGSLCVMVGLVFLLAPGLYLSVRWFFVTPIIVVEGLGVFASMKRSWNLVSGAWCYVFCTVFICRVVFIILSAVWTDLLMGLESTGALFSVYGTMIALVPTIVFGPFLSILMTIMYFNMRIEKEGLNERELIRNMCDSGALENVYTPLDLEEDEGVNESPLLDDEPDIDV